MTFFCKAKQAKMKKDFYERHCLLLTGSKCAYGILLPSNRFLQFMAMVGSTNPAGVFFWIRFLSHCPNLFFKLNYLLLLILLNK